MTTSQTPLPDLDKAFEQLIEFVDKLGKEYNFVPWWAALDGAEQQADDDIELEGWVAQE